MRPATWALVGLVALDVAFHAVTFGLLVGAWRTFRDRLTPPRGGR